MYIKFVFSNVIQELFQEDQFSGERRIEHEIDRLYNCRNIMEILEVTEENIREYESFLERSMSESRNEVAAVKKLYLSALCGRSQSGNSCGKGISFIRVSELYF